MNWDFLKRVFSTPEAPDPHIEVIRGADADVLLSNPAYQRAIFEVRKAIHERWAAAPVGDLEGQHELRLMLKVLDDIEGNIKRESDTGKLAAMQIKRKQEEDRRKKDREARSYIRSV